MAVQATGMHAAHVTVPEKDNVGEGVETPAEISFDIVAVDYDSLCEQLHV